MVQDPIVNIPANDDISSDKLEITTMTGCPVMCTICPQENLKENYNSDEKYLSLENFKKALSTVPKNLLINFAGYSEPFANKECLSMIEYALEQGYAVGLYTTLYKVTEDTAKRLIELKKQYKTFCRFYIHLADSSNNMPGFKVTPEYLNVLSLIDTSLNDIVYMTMDEDNEPAIEITKLNIKPQPWIYHDRAENVTTDNPVIKQKNWKNEFIVECIESKTHNNNNLLPNGDLSLCCMDYGLKHIVGNLFKQSYQEIRDGDELKRIKQSNNTIGFHTDVLCRTCSVSKDRTPWNDEEVYELVKKTNPDILGL